MKKKEFSLVSFENDTYPSVAVVPKIWFDEESLTCAWPKKKYEARLLKWVKGKFPPDSIHFKFLNDVRILKEYGKSRYLLGCIISSWTNVVTYFSGLFLYCY